MARLVAIVVVLKIHPFRNGNGRPPRQPLDNLSRNLTYRDPEQEQGWLTTAD